LVGETGRAQVGAPGEAGFQFLRGKQIESLEFAMFS
jgi:hypothetical protein